MSGPHADILNRAIAGDPGAMVELLRAHHARLLAYVRRQLPPELRAALDAADVVQDTVYEACRLIAGFEDRGEDSFFRWLATIARHRIIDARRHQRARRLVTLAAGDDADGAAVAPLLEQLAAHRRTPSRSAAAHEFIAALENALQRLPDAHREAVTLRHVEGLSVAETATRMNRSPDAVYWLCCRGLQAIRTDLRSASLFL